MKEVIVIGAGLAGSEAAWQLAQRGVKVKLYEDDRHEILNETDRSQVYMDLYQWLSSLL